MNNMDQYYCKEHTQLMARCTYHPDTGKVVLESFSKYYDNITNRNPFK